MGKIERIEVSASDRARLEGLVRDRNTPQKVVWRARIVLLAAPENGRWAVVAAVGKSMLTVRRWRRRYRDKGVEGLLKDATRPPRRKPLSAETVKRVVAMTLNTKPPGARRTGASARMAKAAGLSHVVDPADLEGARAQAASDGGPSSCRATPSSPRRSPTSSASTSTRRTRRWCCRSTRRAKSRRSTAPSRDCR